MGSLGNKKDIVIIIPVYKSTMEEFERKSFLQCLSILSKRDIVIITNAKVDLGIYF